MMNPRNSLGWSKTSNLKDPFYVAGKRVFVQGRQDDTPRDKWDGIWDPPIKLVDYVRVGISRSEGKFEWIKNCLRFDVQPEYVEHWFSLITIPTLEIRRRTFIPKEKEGMLTFFYLMNKGDIPLDFKLFIEISVNMRPREQDENPHDYAVTYDSNKGMVTTRSIWKGWTVIFGGDRIPNYCYPGSFRDELLVNGTLLGKRPEKLSFVSGRSCLEYHFQLLPKDEKKLILAVAGNLISEEAAVRTFGDLIKDYASLFEETTRRRSWIITKTINIETPDENLDKALNWAKVDLDLLLHEHPGIGLGFFAGLPWFTMFWGRDSGWILPAVDNYGDFESVYGALSTLAKYQAKASGQFHGHKFHAGEIPNEIRMDGTVTYYSADATPLFVIAAHHHHMWSGDSKFLNLIYPNVVKAVEWGFLADEDKDGLIEHFGDGKSSATWMDSYYRAKSAIEVEALWSHALKCASSFASIMGDTVLSQRWQEAALQVQEKLGSRYWNATDKYFYDTITPEGNPDPSLTANPIVPVIFNMVEQEKAEAVTAKLESPEFTTNWGVRSRARNDQQYHPQAYHKGSIWGLTTGWAALAEYALGKREGIRYLRTLTDLMTIGCLGAIPEILDGDTGTPAGCPLQGWSSSMLIQGVVEGLFGVHPNALTKSVTINPTLPKEWQTAQIKQLHIGDASIEAKYHQEENTQSLSIISNKEYNITAGFKLPSNGKIMSIQKNGAQIAETDRQVRISAERRHLQLYVNTLLPQNQPLVVKVTYTT